MARRFRKKELKILTFIFLIVLAIVAVVCMVKSSLTFVQEQDVAILIFMVTALILMLVIIAVRWVVKRYEKHILEHSIAIKNLKAINEKYVFEEVPNLDFYNSYDNVNFYNDISAQDYLTYQLVYKQVDALRAIAAAKKNAEIFTNYHQETARIAVYGKYTADEPVLFQKLYEKIERKHFEELLKKPKTAFQILVVLRLTNIQGRLQARKTQVFGAVEILNIINGLRQKQGDFYTDDSVWQAICRVERGRVTNKMRFAVYARDHHRCCKCGRSTGDLEVDHIFPISKGGKSTFDNLQTLCHNCNVRKGNTVEDGALDPSYKRVPMAICPKCNAKLIIKTGRYGKFYACPHFPDCKYTRDI